MTPSLFILNSPSDIRHKERLHRHLAPLHRARVLSANNLRPGDYLSQGAHLAAAADLLVVLITADLLQDDAESELQRSIIRARDVAGRPTLPVLVSPCLFDLSPYAHIEPFPADRKCLIAWEDVEAAWHAVSLEVARLLGPERDAVQNDPTLSYVRNIELPSVLSAGAGVLPADSRDTRILSDDSEYVCVRSDESTRQQILVRRIPKTSVLQDLHVFRAECRTNARIRSPYVCSLSRIIQANEDLAFVYDCGRGELLADLMNRFRGRRECELSPLVLAPIVHDVLCGLHAMHSSGVVHRLVTPYHIFLPDGGLSAPSRTAAARPSLTVGKLTVTLFGPVAKICSFASARPLRIGEDELTVTISNSSGHIDQHLVDYCAPERFGENTADARTDIYSLGTTIFHALSGHMPFVAIEQSIGRQKQAGDARSLSRAKAKQWPDGLEEFLRRALHRDPDQRFASAKDMLHAWCELPIWTRA